MRTRTVSGVCRFCSGGCGAIFTVRDDKIATIKGDPAHPVSKGALCPKAEPGSFRGHPARIVRPLWRPPGAAEWRDISWRQAIAKLAAKLKEAREAGWAASDNRTDAIAIFGSAAITNEESYLLAKLSRLLGSNYIEHQARV